MKKERSVLSQRERMELERIAARRRHLQRLELKARERRQRFEDEILKELEKGQSAEGWQ